MVNLAYSSVLEGLLEDIVQFYPELIAQLPSNLTLDTPDDINKLQGLNFVADNLLPIDCGDCSIQNTEVDVCFPSNVRFRRGR